MARSELWLAAMICWSCATPPAPSADSAAQVSSAEASSTTGGTGSVIVPKEPSVVNQVGTYAVRVEAVSEQATAVVKEVAYAQNIGPKIMAASPQVYDALKAVNAPKPGFNVVLYLPDTAAGKWDAAPGIPIEVGVLLNEPTPALRDPVVRSSLPGGRVATTTHWGSYDKLGAAHMAIHDWCAAHGYALTWRNWEVYGHWSDDPAKRRTDVYYLLK